jgi:glycosyltransferase involved in cell wall biosynthesis
MSGGALRGYNILRELSQHFDVRCIYLGDSRELQNALVNENVKIIRPDEQISKGRISQRLSFSFYSRTLCRSSNSTFLELYPTLKKELREFKPQVLYMTELDTLMFGRVAKKTDCLRIVDMYNVNSDIQHQKMQKSESPSDIKRFNSTLKLESRLFKYADMAAVCSTDDKERFATLTGNQGNDIVVVPNGVDIGKMAFEEALSDECLKSIVFVGNLSYPPNQDGIEWFLREAWPIVLNECPGLKLNVVGRGCPDGLADKISSAVNVVFHGEVPEVAPFYNQSGAVIVPLRIGSGTRLKILEAMSLGNPVITTELGCQGIPVEKNVNVAIANTGVEFAKQISDLSKNRNRFDRLRLAAKELMTAQFDWNIIGNNLYQNITQRLKGK